MRIRSFGWVALAAFAAIPFTVACRSTHASSDGVHNMTTNGGKECTEACKEACEKACKEACDKNAKNAQNAYVAPEKAECSKKSTCPMSGQSGNTPQ